jgi:hypothetical protein
MHAVVPCALVHGAHVAAPQPNAGSSPATHMPSHAFWLAEHPPLPPVPLDVISLPPFPPVPLPPVPVLDVAPELAVVLVVVVLELAVAPPAPPVPAWPPGPPLDEDVAVIVTVAPEPQAPIHATSPPSAIHPAREDKLMATSSHTP